MREIKFRAWDLTNRQMYFNGDEFGTTNDYEPLLYKKQGQNVEVMQFTGLKDANGVEIYEGDIVINTDNLPDEYYTSQVIFDTDCGMWVTKYSDGDCEMLSEWSVEAIGNIHENPELLK